MSYDYDLISIGSGSAGRRVAVALKSAGWNTAIVEKDVEHHFGGTCICSGCIPTKALVEKSLHTKDFSAIKEHKTRIVERIRGGTLRHVEERVEADVIRGFATFVDEHTLDVNGKQYTAEIIVIATGSQSAIPPIKGLDQVDYMTSREFLELEEVPKRIIIIGGGRIGLEFGTLYNRLGADVKVFEGLPHLLPGEDEEVSDSIAEYLEEQGMHIYRGRFVDEVKQHKTDGQTEFELILTDGPNKGSYYGDVLLVATGRVPNTAELGLETTGVELNRHAVVVNDYLQSSVSHIFAIGDVIGNPMFTNWASYQSGVLLRNLKKSKEYDEDWEKLTMPNIPRICFIEPELGATGLTEKQAIEKYGEDQVVTYKFYNKWLGKSMIVDDWDGYLKAVGIKGSNEIIGASLWGKRAGSLVQMIVLAMDNGLGWKELASGVYGHPILAEGIYSLAANMKGRTSV